MIKYRFATDINGLLVDINNVTEENRSKKYICVGCKEEMSAVLPKSLEKKRVVERHFRHKNSPCKWESYLHKLGKQRIKERFDTQEVFIIKIYGEDKCENASECPLRNLKKDCNKETLKPFNLKELYDTCEEEAEYKGFRADLKLYSKEKPQREPLFIEISVTHDCEPEKKDSKIRIIEIKIETEDDIDLPLEEKPANITTKDKKQVLPKIRFYNFNKRIFKVEQPLVKFWISVDENGFLRPNLISEGITCQNIEKERTPNSIYELYIPDKTKKMESFSEFLFMKAINSGFEIKHCNICYHHFLCNRKGITLPIIKPNGEKGTIKTTPDNSGFDKTLIANTCKTFTRNDYFINNLYKLHKFTDCIEWKKDRK